MGLAVAPWVVSLPSITVTAQEGQKSPALSMEELHAGLK